MLHAEHAPCGRWLCPARGAGDNNSTPWRLWMRPWMRVGEALVETVDETLNESGRGPCWDCGWDPEWEWARPSLRLWMSLNEPGWEWMRPWMRAVNWDGWLLVWDQHTTHTHTCMHIHVVCTHGYMVSVSQRTLVADGLFPSSWHWPSVTQQDVRTEAKLSMLQHFIAENANNFHHSYRLSHVNFLVRKEASIITYLRSDVENVLLERNHETMTRRGLWRFASWQSTLPCCGVHFWSVRTGDEKGDGLWQLDKQAFTSNELNMSAMDRRQDVF